MTIKDHKEVEDLVIESADCNHPFTEGIVRGSVRCVFEILSRMDDKTIVEFIRKGKQP